MGIALHMYHFVSYKLIKTKNLILKSKKCSGKDRSWLKSKKSFPKTLNAKRAWGTEEKLLNYIGLREISRKT